MSSLTGLPENQLAEAIAAIERDLAELKNRQLVGADSLQISYNKTTSTWDIDETVLSTLTFVRWRVTFVPDHGGVPYAEFGFNYQIAPADDFSTFEAYPDPDTVDGDGIAFIVAFSNNNFSSDTNVKLKFGIKCADTGTISAMRVFAV